MISKKMKYALKALIYIANHQEKDGFVKAHDIAEKAGIPKTIENGKEKPKQKFIEQILLNLKKGRILGSRQGNVGGYYFLKKPNEVTLAEVYRLIEGPIALVPCASKNFYEKCEDCPDETTCSIRHALIQVRDETLKVLEKKNIAELAAGVYVRVVSDFSI
jgi:Rrf2 family protein